MTFTLFILGFVLGGCLGVALMCVLFIAKNMDEEFGDGA